MKKIVALCVVFISLMSFTNTNNEKKDSKKEKHIDITVTSTEGCTIHVVGELSYSIFPPKVTGFVGTVTIGGPKNCPHVTLNLNLKTSKESKGNVSFEDVEICKLAGAKFSTENDDVNNLLNSADFQEAFLKQVKNGLCD